MTGRPIGVFKDDKKIFDIYKAQKQCSHQELFHEILVFYRKSHPIEIPDVNDKKREEEEITAEPA